MAYNYNERGRSPIKINISFLLFFATVSLLFVLGTQAQTPAPSPSSSGSTTTTTQREPVTFLGYDLTTSIELGVRGVSVNGNDNKYRSDFNYRPGFRLFDSSFLLENKDKDSKFIDTFQIISSGWNADPSGFTRISVERAGFYKFDSNIRQVTYFNNLNNHARNGHTADTRHNFGDFDLTLYPLGDKLKFRLGGGFNSTTGAGSITSRAYSDEFPVTSQVDNGSTDLRAGLDSKLLGFNLSFTYGYRRFRDNSHYSTIGNLGYNTTNNAVIATFDRSYPIKGDTQFALFNVQRTFARKLDFTARIAYSLTDRKFEFLEIITGRDNSNNIVDLDRFNISGDSKRPQTRGDLGVTYMVTDNFRISNTFTFDFFNITGGETFAEALFTRTAAGGARNPVYTNNLNYRITSFKRYTNTIEGDYQVRDWLGFNIGYRYTRRDIHLNGFAQNLPPASPTRTLFGPEEEENQTHTIIAGFKAKPLKNWTIFADVEHGDADNAFTRLANYKFTNFRVRSRWSFNQLAFNIAAISKDNENPSTSTAPQGNVTGDFIANIKNRMFSAYADWSPDPRFSISGGYTFTRLTSETDIVINTGTLVRGLSQYYMRDHYAFFDVSAQPFRRVSFFASYNHNEDLGQGNRISVLPKLVSSYPFKLYTMESRLAIRLTRNIDWNVGYKYIGYREAIQPLSNGIPQDYHANLPYTSLRIFFGGGER